MSYGSPVVIRDDAGKLRYQPLKAISTRRDDAESFQETLLQELVDSTPNVLPVREYLPSTTTLFSLGREIPVDLGANQGFIDNLLVTNDGYLVIVETKLYRNPEGIRDVIAQTLQYGMAVGQMSLLELESRIKRGQSPALRREESISDCTIRQATDQYHAGALAEDFDEALERHHRRGEILLLIVSDGIHVGVERVAHWLNEQGNSSPYKFGLVELKFFSNATERLVVPRTVLKTREVSRHVVVVDIRPSVEVTATAQITDEFRTGHGGKAKETRSIKSAPPPLDKEQFLKSVSAEDYPVVAQIIAELEMAGMDQSGTATSLRFGVTYPTEDGAFVPIAYFGKNDLYLLPPRKVLSALEEQSQRELKAQGGELGFYRPDQFDQPNAASLNVKYHRLADNIPKLVKLLERYSDKLLSVLRRDQEN